MAERKQRLLEQAASDFSRFLGGTKATAKDVKCNGTDSKSSEPRGSEPCHAVPLAASAPPSAGTAAAAAGSSHAAGVTACAGAGISAHAASRSPAAPPGRAAGGPSDSSCAKADVAAVLTGNCGSSDHASAVGAALAPTRDVADRSSNCSEDGVAGEGENSVCPMAAGTLPNGSDPLPHGNVGAVQCKTPTRSLVPGAGESDPSKDESDVVMLSSSPSGRDVSGGSDCAELLPEAGNDISLGKKAADSDSEESDDSTTSDEDEDSSSSDADMPDGTSAFQKNAGVARLPVDRGRAVCPPLAPAASSPAPSSFEAIVTGSTAVAETKHAAVQRKQQPAMTEWRQGKALSSPEASDVDDELVVISSEPTGGSDTDSLDEIPSSERKDDRPPKTKGELTIVDLPPIKELQISVPETVAVKEVGVVSAVVDTLVIVQSRRELSALDIDTILFLEGRKPLGKIFEVFGPVPAPLYSVRFNSTAEIAARAVAIGLTVYYAPSEKKLTRYVFVEQLKTARGSDASWKDNNEPPMEVIDYSDDEKERQARSHRRRRGRPHDEVDAAAHEHPTAGRETTGTADGTADNSGNSRSRRGRGRGGRARQFTMPRHQSGESFVVPGANAAQWRGGASRGHAASLHDWSKPPPSLSSTAPGAASPFSVPPPPVQQQHQPPPHHGQNQQWFDATGAPATGPAAWHHQYQQPPPAWQQHPPAAPYQSQPPHQPGPVGPAAWPQVKQEPCEWSPQERHTAWSQAQQQSAWPAVQGPWQHPGSDGPTAVPARGGKAGKRGARAAAAPEAVQPATTRLPFIIDTRYVQSSQQPTDGGGNDVTSSADAKPCSNWPDYDD